MSNPHEDFAGFASPNGTYVPNEFFDRVVAQIDELGELKVTLAIMRATLGWRRRIAQLSQNHLIAITGLSRNAVRRGLEEATKRGTIREAAPSSPRGAATYALRFSDKMADDDAQRWREILDRGKKPVIQKHEAKVTDKTGKLEGYAEMFDALAKACNVDPKIKSVAPQIGKTAGELLAAGYTGEQVSRAFAGDDSWWHNNWRGRSGSSPTLNQLKTTIAEALSARDPTYVEVR
jgi:hypothetical protein